MEPIESFQVLGLDISSLPDKAGLKEAYRRMAKMHHPDRFEHDNELKRTAEAKMIKINLAFQVVSQYLKTSLEKDGSHIKPESEDNAGKKEGSKTKSKQYADKYDKKYGQKKEGLVNLFFSWCINIVRAVKTSAEQEKRKGFSAAEDICGAGNMGDDSHARGPDTPQFKARKHSSWEKQAANPYANPFTENAKKDRFYQTQPFTFAQALEKSSQSFKQTGKPAANRSPQNRANDKTSPIKTADKTKAGSFQKKDLSSRPAKPKKRSLDSAIGKVTKVSPVSRVYKI